MKMGMQLLNTPGRPVKVRGKIFAWGAAASLAIMIAAFVAFSPMTAARTDLSQIAGDGLPVQAQLVTLRTTLANWQFFVEAELDMLAPGTIPDPALLAKGAQLATSQTAQAAGLANGLRRVGFTSDARDLQAKMATLDAAIKKLTPLAAGVEVTAATRKALKGTERAAYQNVWNDTAGVERARLEEHHCE